MDEGISIWKEGPLLLRSCFVVSVKAGAIFRPLVLSLRFLFLAILSLLLFTPRVCPAAEVTLAWDPNQEPTVSGYRVYYGTFSYYYTAVVDVGDQTALTITGLLPGVTYFFSATAYSSNGDESCFSGEIAYTVPGASTSSTGSGGGGGGCFIATAAYGSYLAPEVMELRRFRDRVLLTNRAGQALVEWYYRVSPPVAGFIAGHELLKGAVRLLLTPAVCAVKYPFSAFGVIVAVPVMIFARRRRVASQQRQK